MHNMKCKQCKKKLVLEDIGDLGTYNHSKWFLCKGCSQIIDSFLILSNDTTALQEKHKKKIDRFIKSKKKVV